MQATGKLGCCCAFLHDGILEFLVLFAELFRNRLEALFDNRFVFLICVLHHIVLIRTNNIALELQHFIHALGIHKCLHHVRHSADDGILQQQLPHPSMERIRNRRLILQVRMEQCDDLLGNSIRPEKFFKIQWGHINDGFVPDRD